MSDLEKKSDAIVDEAGAKISALLGEKEGSIQERTGERNKTGNITKEIDKRIKGVEEKIFKALSRQQYIIVIMAVLFIAGMGFFSYLFFMQ